MFISTSSCVKIHHWPNPEDPLEYGSPTEGGIRQISLCNDNTYLALLLDSKKAQIISLKDESDIHLVHTISSVKDVTALCFKHFTKRNLALGTQQGEVLVYDTKLRSEVRKFSKLPSTVNLIEFTCDDKQIGVCCDKSVIIYTEDEVSDEFTQASTCTQMKFHPSISNHFAVGCKNGSVSLWDIIQGARLLNFSEHSAQVTGLALSKTGNILITSGRDHKISIFNTSNAETEFRMNLQLPVTSVDISKDGKVIAAGLEDGVMNIYDMRKLVAPLFSFKVHSSPVNNISFENGTRELCLDSLEVRSNISTIPPTEYQDVSMETFYSPKSGKVKSMGEGSAKNQALERVRNEVFRLVKTEMDDLENQLDEHCLKFQAFLNNEFDIIQNTIREKWNIFNLTNVCKSEDQSQSNMSFVNE